jgi:hypothetical protein
LIASAGVSDPGCNDWQSLLPGKGRRDFACLTVTSIRIV